jgi:spore coat protein U-like protein
VAFACGAGLPFSPVGAATTTTTFSVTATVTATCQVSASTLAFGSYSAAQADASTTISVSCTNLTAYVVSLDAGTGSGATTSTRKMTGPSGQTLNYALFQDSTRLVNWGNVAGVDTVAGVGNGSAQSISVYGRIAASQFSTAGSYSDTVTVTITY